jgi:WD40 repeat protein
LKPDPLPVFKPGQPMSEMALVTNPAPLSGVLSWTLETVGHRGRVCCLAYRPDGRRLASAGCDGTVRVWDPATGKLLRAIVGHNASLPALSLSWSPDGSMLACRDMKGRVSIWDPETGRLIHRNVFGANVYDGDSLAWSPDSRWLAAASERGSAVLNLMDGKRAPLPCGGTRTLVWSPDGKAIACWVISGWESTYAIGAIQIWDMETMTKRGELASKGGHYSRLT